MRPRLSMRAWTQRLTGDADPYGHQGAWGDVLSDEPCYWWSSPGEQRVRPQRIVTLAGEAVMFSRSADVEPGDRIRRLVDHRGRVVWDNADAGGLAREVEDVVP